ncbi:hypothetical protein SORBI_3010G277550 [Sorghum bicolor]|jgi:hypothetical protein|uniref:Uncharacterized protein n=1 Tax=Sorghum bicolor TaxID=4558 RepID=A0A1W0VV58_SORBI|nr:hypothetical protein SORBI_3010G277550 [Sorghum bicolor]
MWYLLGHSRIICFARKSAGRLEPFYCLTNAILPAQLVFRKDQENQKASGVSESCRSFGTRSNVELWFWTFWVLAMWIVGFWGPRPMLRE